MKSIPPGRSFPLSVLLLVMFLLGAGLCGPVRAQAPSAKEITESQQRLEQIKRERAELRTEMSSLRSRVRDLTGELRNIEQQAATSSALLGELDVQIAGTEQEADEASRELMLARNHLSHRKKILEQRLRDIYKRGPMHTAQVLMTAGSFAELLNRYKYLYLLARSDRALMDEVSRLEQQLTLRRRKLQSSLLELQNLQTQKADEHREVERLEQQRRRTLSGFRERERTATQQDEQLAADEKRLQTLIVTLERKRKEAERLAAARRTKAGAAGAGPKATSTASPSLTTKDLGALGWPVDGRLVYRFGRTVQPNGTAVRMNGIGIGAPAGTPVKAVEAGTVVLASPFEGYGPTVVLSHGGGYYSLYLYLKEIAVAEGDEVTRGTGLGTVGGAGTPEGSHLEFQIRAPGGEAVDPLDWLRKRSN